MENRKYHHAEKRENIMKPNTDTASRRVGAAFAGAVLTGMAVAVSVAPAVNAAPCMADEAANTISSVAGAAGQYLSAHPGANQALSDAASQPRDQARTIVRDYFTANPGEYFDLKGITAPLLDLRNRCGSVGLPSDLISAFDEFQAG
jgi:heme-binding protein